MAKVRQPPPGRTPHVVPYPAINRRDALVGALGQLGSPVDLLKSITPRNPDSAGRPWTMSAGRIPFGIDPEEFLLLLDFARSRKLSNLNRTSARRGSQTVHSANLSANPGTDTSETRPARIIPQFPHGVSGAFPRCVSAPQLSVRAVHAGGGNRKFRFEQADPEIVGKYAGFDGFASASAPGRLAADEKGDIRTKISATRPVPAEQTETGEVHSKDRKVMAAFELPPPSPAPIGIFFSRQIAYALSIEAARLKSLHCPNHQIRIIPFKLRDVRAEGRLASNSISINRTNRPVTSRWPTGGNHPAAFQESPE